MAKSLTRSAHTCQYLFCECEHPMCLHRSHMMCILYATFLFSESTIVIWLVQDSKTDNESTAKQKSVLMKGCFFSQKMPISVERANVTEKEWKSIWHNINIIRRQTKIYQHKTSTERMNIENENPLSTIEYGRICISIVYGK